MEVAILLSFYGTGSDFGEVSVMVKRLSGIFVKQIARRTHHKLESLPQRHGSACSTGWVSESCFSKKIDYRITANNPYRGDFPS